VERLALDVAQSPAVRRNADLTEGRGAADRTRAGAPLVDHQVLRADERAVGHHDRALDDVLELTHVARPAMLPDHGHGVEPELAPRRPMIARRLGQEMIGDQVRIVLALAKRRQLDPQHGQLREQILAEESRRNVVLEARLARRDDPAMRRRLVADAEAGNVVLLEPTQQAALQRQRQTANLVEKDRAAPCRFEHAELSSRVQPVRRDAEQLDLEQRRRNRRAVDRDERRGGMMPRVVNAACDELLARARFTGQQQRPKRRRGNATRHVQRVAHAGALGNDGRELVGPFACGVRSLK